MAGARAQLRPADSRYVPTVEDEAQKGVVDARDGGRSRRLSKFLTDGEKGKTKSSRT